MSETSTRIPVLAPTGELDLAASRGLRAALSEHAGTAGGTVLDLTGVGFIDSTGLGVVLKAAGRFHRQDKRLVLVVEPGSNVDRLLDLSGARGRLAIAASREQAIERAALAP